MSKGKLKVVNLSEDAYVVKESNYERVSTKKRKKKKKKSGLFTVPSLLSILFICSLLSGAMVGGLFTKDVEGESSSILVGGKWGRYFSDNVVMDSSASFEGAIKKYFKSEYGKNVSVYNVKECENGLEANVKVIDDDNAYNFVYTKKDKKVDVYEDYGSRYTGRLLSKRLNELYKNKLPNRSDLWVVTDSLTKSGIPFDEIEDTISKWDIAEIMSYNKSNHLIKEINMTILTGTDSNLRSYAKRIVDVVTTLDASEMGVPKLNVGFFKGKNSRNYVYEDIANRRGISKEDIDFTIDWYEEIPKIKGVKNYMWGAISISENAGLVLNNYIETKETEYTIEGSDEVKPIYKKVKELID